MRILFLGDAESKYSIKVSLGTRIVNGEKGPCGQIELITLVVGVLLTLFECTKYFPLLLLQLELGLLTLGFESEGKHFGLVWPSV